MRISFFAGVSATILTCNELQLASALKLDQQDSGEIRVNNKLAQTTSKQDSIKAEWKTLFDSYMLPQTWDALLSDTQDSLATQSFTQVSSQMYSAIDLATYAIAGGWMVGVFGSMFKNQFATFRTLADLKKENCCLRKTVDCQDCKINFLGRNVVKEGA